jgi:predicted amidohydrolase YtcJ
VRFAYNLFPQKAGAELEDFESWAKQVKPGQGTDMYRHNGGGEMLVYTAADFEDFREPRPELAASMEAQLERVTRFLAQNGWPFRLHATYDETISRALDVFEKVHRDVPIDKLHWFFDHAETITPRNIERVKALGGGIAVQHRMMYQGEDFVQRYGAGLLEDAPPVKRILEAGVPIGAGTDATRVASYNPWISLYWLVSGRTIGGTPLYPQSKRLDRATALRLWTVANSWFSNEEGKKGAIKVGQLADFAVLSDDYMKVPEERIKSIVSLLTVVGGDVAHGDAPFSKLAPPLPPASPDWSPVARYGGYYRATQAKKASTPRCTGLECAVHGGSAHAWLADAPTSDAKTFWGAFGCSCWMA